MATWSELVRLMDAGPVVSARGVHRCSDPDEPPAVTVAVPVDGPDRWKVETLDGSPISLADGQRIVEWQPGRSRPQQWPAEDGAFVAPDAVLLLSPVPAREWHRDDYHQPAREPVRDVVLGRPCWRVDLLPPAHKRGQFSMWVDEATGARLRLAHEEFGVLEEFLELELAVDLAADTFRYDGPVDLSPPAFPPDEQTDGDTRGRARFHVTSSANRQSIAEHGLDWRRMGAAPGIAGSQAPEQAGCFLAEDEATRDWFVWMNNTGGPVDVWEVLDVARDDLRVSPEGFGFFPGVIGPERLRLLQRDLPPQHD